MTSRPRSSASGPPVDPARARNPTFTAKWEQFTRLRLTDDTLTRDRQGLRRWTLLPFIALVIPVDDPAVRAQLTAWQSALADTLPYLPQPSERTHITLHHVGQLRTRSWLLLPHTWPRGSLGWMAARVRVALAQCPSFTVEIGPLNAFPNVLLAEVHDDERESLRALRLRVRRALPLRARPSSPWSYLPHVTLGHWGQQPVAPLLARLRPLRDAEPLPLHVTRLRFTIYWRSQLPATPDVLARAREELIAEYPLLPRD